MCTESIAAQAQNAQGAKGVIGLRFSYLWEGMGGAPSLFRSRPEPMGLSTKRVLSLGEQPLWTAWLGQGLQKLSSEESAFTEGLPPPSPKYRLAT